jgi:hypothetical protein
VNFNRNTRHHVPDGSTPQNQCTNSIRLHVFNETTPSQKTSTATLYSQWLLYTAKCALLILQNALQQHVLACGPQVEKQTQVLTAQHGGQLVTEKSS